MNAQAVDAANNSWMSVLTFVKGVSEKTKKVADKAECAVAAYYCGTSTFGNANAANVNPDLDINLEDAIQCQQQAQATGQPPLCSDPEVNNLRRSGIMNAACQKAFECALGATTP